MATTPQKKSLFFGTLEFAELVFHSVVREVRTQSGSTTFGVLKEVTTMAIFLGIFYMISLFMGRGGRYSWEHGCISTHRCHSFFDAHKSHRIC